jgi:hypothetical protein
MACPNPFKDSDCDAINQQLQTVHDTLELAAKCGACGLAVEGYVEQLTNIQDTLKKIKQQFFPQRN